MAGVMLQTMQIACVMASPAVVLTQKRRLATDVVLGVASAGLETMRPRILVRGTGSASATALPFSTRFLYCCAQDRTLAEERSLESEEQMGVRECAQLVERQCPMRLS